MTTKLTMSGEQRGELKRMLNNLPYYTGKEESRKVCPVTPQEKAAQKLIACQAHKREMAKKKLRLKYEDAKAKAREAVFLGDDLKAALKAIKYARSLATVAAFFIAVVSVHAEPPRNMQATMMGRLFQVVSAACTCTPDIGVSSWDNYPTGTVIYYPPDATDAQRAAGDAAMKAFDPKAGQ